MPLDINLHAIPHLKGLIYGKIISCRQEHGSIFIEEVAQKLRPLPHLDFEVLKDVAALILKPQH